MKTLRWNIGIMVIRLGYKIRGGQQIDPPFKIHEKIGRVILIMGYSLRGAIPQKTWKWNHI